MIDDAVYFSSSEVLGGVPLREGDTVNCIAVRDGAQGGWKALRVEKNADAWEDGGKTSLEADNKQLRPLIGTVTAVDANGGFINQTTFLQCHSLCEGYQPMKGDWIQAKYFIDPTKWTSQSNSVAPLRYCRLNQVRVSSVYGKTGVVDDHVFFSLDSLLLPAHYWPLQGDLVNLVMVESSESLYSCRALCMAPCLQCVNAAATPLPEDEIQGFMEDKGGLAVTFYGQFGDLLIGESRQLVFWIQNLGSCAELLLRHFSSFTIGRRLEVTVGSKEERLLQSCVPYTPYTFDSRPAPIPPKHVITVSTPGFTSRFTKRRLPNFLGNYPAPQTLRDCVEAQGDVLVAQPSLGEVLSSSNMHARFSALLWLEELQAEKELKEFTINGALLRKGAAYLHLEVLGLAEGRPSLSIGDRVSLKKHQSHVMVMEYIGYVTEINDEDVSLRVNSEFQHSYLGEPLDVEFTYNRLTTRRCHHALNQVKPFWEILFPTKATVQAPQWTGTWTEEPDEDSTMVNNEVSTIENEERVSTISVDMKSKATQTKDGSRSSKPIPCEGHFFNPQLNPSQKEAVKRIMSGECRPVPYVLFGPPGTGKTITLIEVILQVYHFVPSSRILVCTPSNSAADLICIRLHDSGFLQDASLARVNASSRQEESISEMLRQYAKAGEELRSASFHRIVVSTCSSAGMFHNTQLCNQEFVFLRVGHFTHVFLDEAGQATEPESLIPISLISERDGQIVLAGDPCQLGPVVKSKLASAFGLGVSFLERLMANPLYSRDERRYNPKLDKARAIGQLEAGVPVRRVAALFGVSPGTISKLRTKFRETGEVKDRPRSGRPKKTTSQEDRFLTLASLRNRRLSSRDLKARFAQRYHRQISDQTVRNRLHMASLRAYKAARKPEMTALHRQTRLRWCRQHRQWNLRMWGNVMFRDESRFCLRKLDARIKVTKLIYNYRSHEALLRLPSKLFYKGELCVRAPKDVVESLCHWNGLPKKGFPLLFHGVRSTEMREGNNPSRFNPGEAVQVMLYCCQLAKKLYKPIDASDIGIISPYKKQIRILLGKVGLSDIKVGSVEEFQGQEFLVIIMSTVRSNESVESDDLQSVLGFLADSKRFNVAVTRPKALLIIVGNPHILIKDLCFRALLQYCFDNGAFLGCDPPPSLRASHW
ncbi:RNA helicase Mov10l1-like [Diretmus argenteus]